MLLTPKQRKHLEALAHDLEAVVRIGKGGITPALLATAREALQARELIKVKILDNAEIEREEAAAALVRGTRAELVRVIGRVIILYRPNPDKKHRIEFPAPGAARAETGDSEAAPLARPARAGRSSRASSAPRSRVGEKPASKKGPSPSRSTGRKSPSPSARTLTRRAIGRPPRPSRPPRRRG
ncbi:MAG: RNA binding protein [Candidatus Ozemobacter sibiricus]|jgi:RNA-binding protein|uniref:RNA binding protein n=1 Tax=Candidatus Ozemobacter sibiricus TaxID=2268124 RepID=A0A367ZPH7_9BACT|nr:MAG: RNA binding protein [Candidatus Ozemobacter sibiricus]